MDVIVLCGGVSAFFKVVFCDTAVPRESPAK